MKKSKTKKRTKRKKSSAKQQTLINNPLSPQLVQAVEDKVASIYDEETINKTAYSTEFMQRSHKKLTPTSFFNMFTVGSFKK